MAKDPAVLFYTGDFLAGTSFFTDEQKGQYITLLCQQHQLGTIPKNHMINVCKSYDNPVISKFELDEDGNYYNKRMRLEAEKRRTFCASRSNNLSGRPKKKSYADAYDNHTEMRMGNGNDNGNKDVSEVKIKQKVATFKPPTLDEVVAYCKDRNNSIDAETFIAHYTANGWKRNGGVKITDWKACIITWEKRNRNVITKNNGWDLS